MASVGFDQFWADSKPSDNSSVTPTKKRPLPKYSQVSSMSSPQSTSVTRTPVDMQAAARRKLKRYQQQDPEDPNS